MGNSATSWIMAFASVLIVAITGIACWIADKQLGEQARLNALALRPYLTIRHGGHEGVDSFNVDYHIQFGFCPSVKETMSEVNWIDCKTVELDTLPDTARFCFVFKRRVHLSNVGDTPLRVTHFLTPTLSEHTGCVAIGFLLSMDY